MSKLTLVIEDEDGEFFVTSPDLPELLTSGRSLFQALANAADAVDIVLVGQAKDSAKELKA